LVCGKKSILKGIAMEEVTKYIFCVKKLKNLIKKEAEK
jgi:hypothetical protein